MSLTPAAQEADIVISVMLEMQKQTAGLVSTAKAAAKRAQAAFGKEFKWTDEFKDAFMNTLADRQASIAKQDKFKMANLDKLNPAMLSTYKKNLAELTKQYGKTVPLIDRQNEALKRTQESIKDSPFKGWAMSIMFAGMAIKNMMSQIWASSTKTFNEVKHSVEGTVTGFDMLNGSLKYLGFNVGQALEPLAYMLIPIIDYISQLVMDHPDAFKWLFAALTVIGTAAFAGGSIALATAGIEGMALAFGLASKNAEGIMVYDWANLGKSIQKGVGLISIAWSLEQASDAYKDFTENGNFVSGLQRSLSSIAAATGGWLLWKGKTGAGTAALAIAIGADWLADDTFFENAGWTMGWLVAGMATTMLAMEYRWNNGWKSMVATAIDALTPMTSILGLFGISLGDAIMGSKNEFDWGGAFEASMSEIMLRMREMDKDTAALKERINMKVDTMLNPTQPSQFSSPSEGIVTQTVNNVTYNFVQQTGESNAQFINRIMAEVKAMQVR